MTARQTLELLRDYESRNVLFTEPDGSWPIVWERAKGVHVWDADGNKYLDLTAAFGVAAAGHANSNVVRAGQKQMGKLLHAMGDVHPHARKAELARELSRLTFERWTNPPELKTQNSKLAKSSSATPGSRRLNLRSRRPCSPPASAASSHLQAAIMDSVTARSTPRTANISAVHFASNFARSATSPNFPPPPLI
jgi:hypothetical protein